MRSGPGVDPLVLAGAQGGSRHALIGVLGIRPAQHEPGDEFVEDDPVSNASAVTSGGGLGIHQGWQECFELAPEGRAQDPSADPLSAQSLRVVVSGVAVVKRLG